MLFVSGMIPRIATVVVAFSSCAVAQFFSLATDASGSRLYFATPLRQKNTAQPAYGKVFRMDSSGLSMQEYLDIIAYLVEQNGFPAGNHELEDNMVWRIAELIGVSARDRTTLRKQMSRA